MFRQDLLAGKHILVTGGGTGLGKSIAKRYLELGARVVICGRRLEVLNATVDELHAATGGKIRAVACDIRESENVDSMSRQFGPMRPSTYW